jgi:hypothetical protein
MASQSPRSLCSIAAYGRPRQRLVGVSRRTMVFDLRAPEACTTPLPELSARLTAR